MKATLKVEVEYEDSRIVFTTTSETAGEASIHVHYLSGVPGLAPKGQIARGLKDSMHGIERVAWLALGRP